MFKTDVKKRQSRQLKFKLYRILFGPMLYVRAIYRQLLILVALFIVGAIIFAYFENVPPLVALFASVSTVTIIGLFEPNNGNFTTMNRTENILVMGLILASVTSGAAVLQGMVSVAANKTVEEETKKRLILKLDQHIIVYGYDHMGKYVTDKLEEVGYDYVVITRNTDVYSQLLSTGTFVVFESKTDPIEALKSSGIEKSSMIIVTDQNDSDNLRFILTARKLRPDIRIHTVVGDPTLVETAKDAGANVVIASSVAVGQLLAFSASAKDLAGIAFSEKVGATGITEYVIPQSSPLIGRKLDDVARSVSIIGVLRNGKVDHNTFDGNFTLNKKDILLIIGDATDLKKFEEQQNKTH